MAVSGKQYGVGLAVVGLDGIGLEVVGVEVVGVEVMGVEVVGVQVVGDTDGLAEGLSLGEEVIGVEVVGVKVVRDTDGLAEGLSLGEDVNRVEVVGVEFVGVGAMVVGAPNGFAVGGFGSPITHELLVCPPNAALQHARLAMGWYSCSQHPAMPYHNQHTNHHLGLQEWWATW